MSNRLDNYEKAEPAGAAGKNSLTTGNEVSLADMVRDARGIYRNLRDRKWFIGKWLVAGLVVGVVLAFTLPETYQASTLLMPPHKETSALSGLGSLSGIGNLDQLGGTASGDTIVALLKSEFVEDEVIRQAGLKAFYESEKDFVVRRKLEHDTAAEYDKRSSLLTIKVKSGKPEVAAKIANAYVAALTSLLNKVAITDAQQRTVLYKDEIKKTLNAISSAEIALAKSNAQYGVRSLSGQVETSIRSASQLRAEITAADVNLATLKQFETDQNPEVQALVAKRDAMIAQLRDLERGQATGGSSDDSSTSTSFENVRTFQELKYQQQMLVQLRSRLDQAELDRAKEGPLIQQIDPAAVPEHPVAPSKPLVILGGMLIGMLYAFVRVYLDKVR